MASSIVGGRKRFGERTASGEHYVQEFVPSAAWTEDSLHHFLLVDLPGVKKEEVKLQVDKSGDITISGERKVNGNKYLYFEKKFKAPHNSDVEKVTQKFEGEILYVSVPKQAQLLQTIESPKNNIVEKDHIVKEQEKMSGLGDIINQNQQLQKYEQIQKQEIKKISGECSNSVEGFKREEIEKWGGENSMLERAIFMVRKNSHILVIAALAFTLGVLVSRKS